MTRRDTGTLTIFSTCTRGSTGAKSVGAGAEAAALICAACPFSCMGAVASTDPNSAGALSGSGADLGLDSLLTCSILFAAAGAFAATHLAGADSEACAGAGTEATYVACKNADGQPFFLSEGSWESSPLHRLGICNPP